MKQLYSGNEAVSRGAWEAGAEIAAAYPGTPSTEILENIAKYKEIYAEWSVNEKVAFEVAFGAAVAGKRSLAAMKHVGVNVAADALMTAAYTGVNAGFVLVTADDPGMHSSQNEQDNRYMAKFAQIPMLEPADSQEAKDFVRLAFEISEKYDTPVMLRMTTRVCHGKGLVETGERITIPDRDYVKDPQKYVMIPANARKRHIFVEQRNKQLAEFSEQFSGNVEITGDTSIGIVTSGISYQYAREALPKAAIFKIGMTNPLPINKIKAFAARVKKLLVIEELEPFIEEQLRAAGFKVSGKDILPRQGEYSPELLCEIVTGVKAMPVETGSAPLPARPPVMCAGCPHRAVFHVLKKMNVVVSGDIGCYTLSTLPPLNTMDTVVCMGSSIGMAQGMVRALDGKKSKRVVSVLGDSTFIHSGIPSLVNAVYNRANITIIILDNRITAMTGHQQNPGTGVTLQGQPVHEFDFVAMAQAAGVSFVQIVDPIDIEETKTAISRALEHEGPSVVIARRPCVLIDRHQYDGPMQINPDRCKVCKICLRIGCPAISMVKETIRIDASVCFGCSLCRQVCPHDAISLVGRE